MYVDQTEFSSHAGSTTGNCLSACVANLLSVPLEGIPNFAKLGGAWFPAFTTFLRNNGYNVEGSFYFRSGGWEDLLVLSCGVDSTFICCGPSPRFVGLDHAVLYKDGLMLHDPHPSRSGLLELRYAFMIESISQTTESL